MGRHNNDSPQKKEREARKAERRLARMQRRVAGVTAALPAGTGWTGTGNGDLSWEPLRDGEDLQGGRLRVGQSGR